MIRDNAGIVCKKIMEPYGMILTQALDFIYFPKSLTGAARSTRLQWPSSAIG